MVRQHYNNRICIEQLQNAQANEAKLELVTAQFQETMERLDVLNAQYQSLTIEHTQGKQVVAALKQDLLRTKQALEESDKRLIQAREQEMQAKSESIAMKAQLTKCNDQISTQSQDISSKQYEITKLNAKLKYCTFLMAQIMLGRANG